MLSLQHISYIHPNKDVLFDNISLTINKHDKVALTGNNGVGKSTLLKIIAGELQPSTGQLTVDAPLYYVPQIFGQFNHLTVAQALGVEERLRALSAILGGDVTAANLDALNDDWTIEERCAEALTYWELVELSLDQKLETLSGGQKTKVFLAGISIHQPALVLLDEPSNHLDKRARQLLYDFIRSTSSNLLVVSHDRQLLNLLDTVCELSKRGIAVYGGNYEFYAGQKLLENNALSQDLKNKEKELRKAREKERDTLERQQKLDARGKKKQEKAGLPTISMNTLRNNAEKSTSRIQGVHAEKTAGISEALRQLRHEMPDPGKMKLGFDNSSLHKGKMLFSATGINMSYSHSPLWKQDLDLQIHSGERIALKGLNGSGKTTLIKLILGKLEAQRGTIYRAESRSVYIDQDYSLIDNQLQVYQQSSLFNTAALQEHEIKTRLSRFLFAKADWDKQCGTLSGGEKMRLMLCYLTMAGHAPDILVLDEPTNNLDLQSIGILTAAVNEYEGTLIVVSHDAHFLEQVQIGRTVEV